MFITEELKQQFIESYKKRAVLLCSFLDKTTAQIDSIENEDYRYSMYFLYSHLPISDISEEGAFELLSSFVESAFSAREELPWGSKIPLEIFLSDVLFPRVGTEELEASRGIFHDLLLERVKNKTMEQAVIETNYFCLEQATYRATDRRTVPPTTMLKSSYGRCGEEAVFAVMALRSLCIPSRVIYTPSWAHTDNNHAWVEAWVDGKWHYFGACEPEEVLDRGWFTSAASRAMLVESRSFFQSDKNSSKGELIRNGILNFPNLTSRYANTKLVTVSVKDNAGEVIVGAKVNFQIINHARYSTLNSVYTNADGLAYFVSGIGSLNIHVVYNGEFVEQWINTEKQTGIEILFNPELPKDEKIDIETYAPKDPGNKVIALSKETNENHKLRVKLAQEKRQAKENETLSTIKDIIVNKEYIDETLISDILFKAKGNGEEIIDFIENNPTSFAQKLLVSLSEKDYTDINAKVITANLSHALKYKDNWPEDIFVNYILAPRIYFEPIKEYREYIEKFFSEPEKEDFRKNPEKIWDYIKQKISYYPEEEYSAINISVKASLEVLQSSPMGKKILFVAICRTLGIPARLSPDTLDIEYYFESRFISPIQAEVRDAKLELEFQKDIHWVYSTNWSLSALENGEFTPLVLKDEEINNKNVLNLKSGYYRLVTSNRLPNGDIFAKQNSFEVSRDVIKKIAVELQRYDVKNMYNHVEIGDFTVKEKDKSELMITRLLSSEKNLILWLSENNEPTNHILNELIKEAEAFKLAKINIVFLLSSYDVSDKLIFNAANTLGAKVAYDTDFSNQEPVARRTYTNPEQLPLIVLTQNKLNSIFATSGYNVGTALLILELFGK